MARTKQQKPLATEEQKMIKVDHSQMGLVPIEPGFYGFKVLRTKKVASKSSAGQNAVVTAVITEADNDEMLGKQVVDNLPLQENTLWRINNFYQACTGDPLPEGDYSESDLYDLIAETKDTDFHAEVTIEKYEGRDRNRLSNFAE